MKRLLALTLSLLLLCACTGAPTAAVPICFGTHSLKNTHSLKVTHSLKFKMALHFTLPTRV